MRGRIEIDLDKKTIYSVSIFVLLMKIYYEKF